MKNDRKKWELTRRDFIKGAGATSAGLAVTSIVGKRAEAAPTSRPASARIIGANDRINYGIVGVGGMGSGHLNIIMGIDQQLPSMKGENVAVVAVADVFEKRRLKAKEAANLSDDQVYTDYRRLIERKDVDAVIVATPDHWHGQMGVAALEAGKHLYIEKPMTHKLEEAFQIYDAAKRANRVVQVGAHGCSDPKWLKAREVVSSGRLGKLLWVQGSYCRNNPAGEWNYPIEPEANEQTIDWKMWLGNAPKRAWDPERYFRWRKYWDYGTGIIGDLWPHRLHPLMLAMNVDEFPKSVSCIGRRLSDRDNGNGEIREVADTTMLTVEFPSGAMIFLAGSTINELGIEDIIRGEKANLLLGGPKVQVQPERPFVEQVEASDETPPDSGENHAKHQKNFIDSLRSNTPPSANIELGVRVQTIISLAEASYKTGKTMQFDAAKRKVHS